ncbi:pentapeptide repeat-containing protein [Empedobacter stercoris]|uniref:Pentapeptide repeat-containing protein n=1 Tax=Empedobacter stercoris TaxID=1628248 RepID=A0ABX1WMY5_9FLAO|nr:pentapeptide repeat-containing protein [Empedobacter stercoris]NOJ75910.1 pentapeptide repeat-containing protein [Empedobacter stercoris]
MTTTSDIQNIIEKYKAGHRHFLNLDFDKGEKLIGELLTDTIFHNCCFSVDFSQTDLTNTKFIDCNLKCSDFSNCNLTNTIFENCSLERTEFKNAKTDGTNFANCYCYGQLVMLDNETWELETLKDPLVKELYDNIPEFSKMTDHSDDELQYVVYGELSLKLFDDIILNKETTNFTKKCFQFFNLLGNRQDNDIDNLLVVGVYEGLYTNKKCNDIARQLLSGRNKEIYEHWMINGNIRAEY